MPHRTKSRTVAALATVALFSSSTPSPASPAGDAGEETAAAVSDGGASSGRATPGPPIDLDGEQVVSCRACTRALSFRHPLCVEGPTAAMEHSGLAVLAAADRAWDAVADVLGAPTPDGTSDGLWHIELVDSVNGGGDARLAARDALSRFDRGSSFATVDRGLRPGCPMDLALARAIARGSLWRAAPATNEASARAETETLARLATGCADDAARSSDEAFEARPERAIVDAASPVYERGAFLFYDWLDTMFAKGDGTLVLGLWALAPTRTPFGASRWAGSPSGFDVLRTSLRGALFPDSTLDDVFVRFAVHRFRVEPAPRLAWNVDWPDHARRLAAPSAIAPTGASYVVVRHDNARPGSKLRVEFEWEDYGRLRWVIVKLDAAGRAIGELPVSSLDRVPRVSMTVEAIDGVDRLLIVGVNVGSTDHPFDPNQADWEPHGWLITLAAE